MKFRFARRDVNLSLFTLALLTALLSPANAYESTRSVRLGVGPVGRTDTTQLPSSQALGPTVWGAYDFNLSEGFSVGMNLAYRYYWGAEGLGQLGYGLLLKHTFLPIDAPWRPFLQYGLLFHLTSRTGHTGVPAAHDTLLSAGVETQHLFFHAGFHISHLSGWDVPTIPMSYWEVVVGYRWTWFPRSHSKHPSPTD